MNQRAFAFICCALLSGYACGDDGAANDNTASNQQPLRCAVGEVRACPCVGTGSGMQSCNAEGTGYGACTGCPATSTPGTAGTNVSGNAGTAPAASAGRTGAGGSAGGAGGSAGSGAGGAGSGAGGAAGTPGASGAGGGSEPTQSSGTAPGVSCGVGLPSLCALETEKCCMRSLETDTCIEANASCTCMVADCTVMEARCDGPEDCSNGQVCCGTLSGDGMGYDEFVCAAQCMSTGNQRVACHEDMDTCPGNLICANSQLLTNVQICIDPATIEQ